MATRNRRLTTPAITAMSSMRSRDRRNEGTSDAEEPGDRECGEDEGG